MTDTKRKELLSKAKPIVFNTDMVRAILDGRKTVARRVLKNQNSSAFDYDYNYDTDGVARSVDLICDNGNNGLWAMTNKIPYFEDDILYVRETWSPVNVRPQRYLYKTHCSEAEDLPVKWHPSIHMPKEAARIFLRVTNVRVERLQNITQEQATAEGFVFDTDLNFGTGASARRHFFEHWDNNIKKSNLDKYGWDANPFVWVIEFERID